MYEEHSKFEKIKGKVGRLDLFDKFIIIMIIFTATAQENGIPIYWFLTITLLVILVYNKWSKNFTKVNSGKIELQEFKEEQTSEENIEEKSNKTKKRL